ncbi:hypothetical protein E4U55_005668 [Claviceps digitariae]|nr:hypothetical protein E4U55_005668 [Claviceps digitariae]
MTDPSSHRVRQSLISESLEIPTLHTYICNSFVDGHANQTDATSKTQFKDTSRYRYLGQRLQSSTDAAHCAPAVSTGRSVAAHDSSGRDRLTRKLPSKASTKKRDDDANPPQESHESQKSTTTMRAHDSHQSLLSSSGHPDDV